MDKDGRLTAEEFAIAMHLLEKAKAGLTLPDTLPASLSPSSTKFNTVGRASPRAARKVCQSSIDRCTNCCSVPSIVFPIIVRYT